MNQRTESGGGATPPRLSPYEAVFATPEYESRVFPRIHAEAERRGVDALQRDQFHLLASAAEAVQEVVPDEASPEAFEQYHTLLFHAFNFWRFGRWIYLTDTAVARYLVEAKPAMHDWELALPHPSVYVQLPHNLFWGSISPDSTPEPVDGFFLTAAPLLDAFGDPFQRLEVLLVLGMRRDRAGFSVIPFDTEAGPGIVQEWAVASGREQGEEFETVLPGGELSGLYSILTAGEAVKLLGRVLWYVDTFPESVHPEAAPELGPAGDAPIPRLPYQRISLTVHEEP